jgi:gamma-glutamylcyclotransferase (GGCT)/AIG2-like uncharacterized protein YtfP
MAELSLPDATRLIAAANAARGWGDGPPRLERSDAADAEGRLETLLGVSWRLAVYGTLAPGRPNHHVVASLGGGWTDGVVEGDLSAEGWGATLGYPAFRPRAGGAAVAVQVLTSPALPAAWAALDEFEGAEYRRILVPVLRPDAAGERALQTVANIYAAAAGAPGGPARAAR